MLIYIAGPYSARAKKEMKQNIRKAEEVAAEVLMLGMLPIIPHKITSFFPERFQELRGWEHKDWIQRFCLPLLERCDAVVMADGWEDSEGARLEFAHAKEKKIIVFESIEQLKKNCYITVDPPAD